MAMMFKRKEPPTFQARMYFDLSGRNLSEEELMDESGILYEVFERVASDLDLGPAICVDVDQKILDVLITIEAATPAEATEALKDVVARFDAQSSEFRGRVTSTHLEEPLAA